MLLSVLCGPAVGAFAQGVEVDGGRVTRIPGAGEIGVADSAPGTGVGGSATYQELLAAGREAQRHPLVETGGGPMKPGAVLARSRQGVAVTAGDLFLHLCLMPQDGRAQAVVDAVEAPDPQDRAEAKAEIQRALAGYALTHLSPAAVPDSQNTPELRALRDRAVLARLAHYHYLDTEVRSEASVSVQDREKFRRENGAGVLEPFRLSVKYIQVPATGVATVRGSAGDTVADPSAETRLQKIREDILAGRIGFEAAARRYSSAPSKNRGGEIPPFRSGELFSLFEEQAMKLEPGQLSPVFPGPGGFYLVKMIRRLPARDEDRKEDLLRRESALNSLDRQLDRRAWRNAYAAILRDVQTRTPLVDHVLEYETRAPRERLGQAGSLILTRGEFDSLFPRVPGTGLTPTNAQRAVLVRSLLLGGALQQAHSRLMRAGKAPDFSPRDLAMAQRVADRMALEAALAEQANGPISEEELARFHSRNPKLFAPVGAARVARLRLEITDPGLIPLAEAPKELARITATLKSGGIPAGAQPPGQPSFFLPPGVLEDQQVFGGISVAEATPEEIARAIGQAAGIPVTSGSLPLIVPLPRTADSSTTEPVAPSAQKPEATTSQTLSQTDSTTPSLTGSRDDSTTVPEGGGAPEPAAGGLPPTPNIPDFAASQPDKPRRPAKPVRAVLLSAAYQSPIYRLVAQDYGWQVVEDRSDIPQRVARLGVGEFTAPRLTRRGAESWHVAERLATAPLPLDQVRREATDALVGARYRALLAAETRRAVRSTGVGRVSDSAVPVKDPAPRDRDDLSRRKPRS